MNVVAALFACLIAVACASKIVINEHGQILNSTSVSYPDVPYTPTIEHIKQGDNWPPYPSQPYFTDPYFVGGFGGTGAMTYGGMDGRLVSELEFWFDTGCCFNGVRFTFTDGSASPLYGVQAQSYARMTLGPAELITQVLLWGDGDGTRTGRISITTNSNQVFTAGKSNVNGQNTFSAPVGSGLLVGLSVRSGAQIDMLGLIFFKNLQPLTITNVVYTGAPIIGSTTGLAPVVLQSFNAPNSGFNNMSWTFGNSITKTTSQTFTSSTAQSFSASVTISADLFGIGGSASAGWQQTQTSESALTTSTDTTLVWALSGELTPGQGVECSAITDNGNLNLQWSGILNVAFKDGTPGIQIKLNSGTYQNVVYSAVNATCSNYRIKM